ncbi:MAG: hypothetical protein Q8Q89_04065 [bacterium]|nr:hypothetical protein [bacterium]
MIEFPTRKSLQPLIEEIRGSESGPKDKILNEISDRVTRGMDEADAMRFELYLMDILRVVEEGGEKQAEELLVTIKGGDSFANLSTVMNIPDSTTLAFITEIKEKLLSQK